MGREWSRKLRRPQLGDFLPRFIIEEALGYPTVGERGTGSDPMENECCCGWSDVELEQKIEFHDIPEEHFKTKYYCPACGDLIYTFSQYVAGGGRIN